uniref:BRK domain-containing protein n=1 Tax=Heterorhabditis bacteriophora TaxID=37862 RepID=A0A1I7WP72_HETBA
MSQIKTVAKMNDKNAPINTCVQVKKSPIRVFPVRAAPKVPASKKVYKPIESSAKDVIRPVRKRNINCSRKERYSSNYWSTGSIHNATEIMEEWCRAHPFVDKCAPFVFMVCFLL